MLLIIQNFPTKNIALKFEWACIIVLKYNREKSK